MFNVRLAGGHLYGKQLFTWLSLVVSFMASFVLSFSRWMSWMGSGTYLSQFLRDSLPTLPELKVNFYFTYVHENKFYIVCFDFYDLATAG